MTIYLFKSYRVKFALWLTVICVVALTTLTANAQKRRGKPKTAAAKRAAVAPVSGVIVDERLAVLRLEPGLTAIPLQRMRTGREVLISGARQIDGITFYRVQLSKEKGGWVQADAVASTSKTGDDERTARLIRAFDGFDKIELAAIFLENFQKSSFRPALLLLFGDLIEEAAQKLSRDALRKLKPDLMQANGAPVDSYFMNFSELDRYRKLGVNFDFDRDNKQFHYDGATWQEIVQKYPKSNEAAEAKKRLQTVSIYH